MLNLPVSVRLDKAPQLWKSMEASLRVEAAQVGNAAGRVLELDASALQDFDSSALTLLLGAARLCAEQGLTLTVSHAPAKLQDLARVYGVEELLWPRVAAPAEQTQFA